MFSLKQQRCNVLTNEFHEKRLINFWLCLSEHFHVDLCCKRNFDRLTLTRCWLMQATAEWLPSVRWPPSTEQWEGCTPHIAHFMGSETCTYFDSHAGWEQHNVAPLFRTQSQLVRLDEILFGRSLNKWFHEIFMPLVQYLNCKSTALFWKYFFFPLYFFLQSSFKKERAIIPTLNSSNCACHSGWRQKHCGAAHISEGVKCETQQMEPRRTVKTTMFDGSSLQMNKTIPKSHKSNFTPRRLAHGNMLLITGRSCCVFSVARMKGDFFSFLFFWVQCALAFSELITKPAGRIKSTFVGVRWLQLGNSRRHEARNTDRSALGNRLQLRWAHQPGSWDKVVKLRPFSGVSSPPFDI